MRRARRLGLTLCVGIVFLCSWRIVLWSNRATAAPTGTILIGQIKITTADQFISLYNNSDSEIDMSTIQLAYYNYYDLTNTAKLTSSRYIPLSGKLPSHSYYIVSDGALTICYKTMVSTQSLGFSSTAGTVQVTQNGPGNVLDSVAWSKAGTTNTALPTGVKVWALPSAAGGFLQRSWLAGLPKTAGDPWVPVAPITGGCDLEAQLAAEASTVPPVDAPTQAVKAAVAPKTESQVQNLGLVAPELSELLPNPADPETDDENEYIELYNPNNTVFDLTDYRLEAGTSYSRGYTFTSGSLAPNSYTAFMITDTNLQLSNGEGQVRLLAPDGTTISETPGYEDAPEGESWSRVGDSWQWSNTRTPNAANLPSAESSGTTKTTAAKPTKKSTGKVAGTSTTTPSDSPKELDDAAPLHPLVLAGVGFSAVAYAGYEYRKDMANRFFKIRRYFRNRQTARSRL